jgi:acetyl coenzyme A synthetase (ADP forming)-like protein
MNEEKAEKKWKKEEKEELVRNLKYIFQPNSVAVIGASRDPTKIGHVLFRNFLESGFLGKVYPINPNVDYILDEKCYPSIIDVPGEVDCAIIAVPAQVVPKVLKECGEKGVKSAIGISSGFAEVGNYALEEEVRNICLENNIALIGMNCLGIINPETRVDCIFLPMYKLKRPKLGNIAFIAQSGAVGSCVIDLAADLGVGISKFVSYGNATVINECDLLEYLLEDKRTKIIAAYFETIKDGKRFIKVASEVTKKKPIIAIKAGKTASGAKAAKSHTAAMAGDAEVYSAVFKQTRVIEVESLTDLFDYSKVFLQPPPKNNRVAIITNGGGVGVLTTDWAEKNGLKLAEFSEETKKKLREKLPNYVNIANPLDLAGDADSERYALALSLLLDDENVDAIIVILLFQTVSLDSNVNDIVISASNQKKKPIVVISIGGEYATYNKKILEEQGVPTYTSPYVATGSLAKLTWYYRCITKGICTPL